MSLALTLLLLPLVLGTLINGILGAYLTRRASAVVGCVAIGLAFVGALVGVGESGRLLLYEWIAIGSPIASLQVDVAFKFDPLSGVMTLIITGVSALIHVYATGYMAHENQRGFSRFFAYLNLFVFAMLLLVLADNYLLMFVGWEGVGLCSYLLIGFWYDRERKPGDSTFPSQAAKKAFVVNRIGDLGFLLAMFLLFSTFGTLQFDSIFAVAGQVPDRGLLSAITLLLFLGAVGKSAQIPLYVWLPDAMQGPTPVSALIHAATMVTAGVYMVARSHVLFALAGTGDVVAWVGIVTALFAATMAMTSFDFKGVLAYSTVSQLGFMFVGVGVGAYGAGIAHLMTHAFFKGLLFLTAGSVLHALGDVGDIRRMGGLFRKMPVTFATFLAAALAISGFPLLSGFFSKDAILTAAYAHSRPIFWIGLLTAFLTAFYMFRLCALVFAGQSRDVPLTSEAHESAPAMKIPMMILAVMSLLAGALLGFGENGVFYRYVEPVFHADVVHGAHSTTPLVLSIVAAFLGIALGYFGYRRRTRPSLDQANLVARIARRKYFVDEAYDTVLVRPIRWVSDVVLWRVVDAGIVDGIVHLVGAITGGVGALLRLFQTGVVQTYAMLIVIAAVVILFARVVVG